MLKAQCFLLPSYGLLLGVGCGMVRETSVLMLSQYFKRRREQVEVVASLGSGLGVILFSKSTNDLIV